MARRTATRSRRSRLRLAAVLAAIAVGIVAAIAGGAFASVSTDGYVYMAGDTVQISGDGMAANENVAVDVAYPDSTLAQEHVVAADGNGNFADSYTIKDTDPPGIYTVTATGQSSGNSFTTTFDPSNTENVAFETSGLPATSVSVTYSGTNPGGNAQSGTSTFTAPGPGTAVGFQGGSTMHCAFPASITVSGTTYNLNSDPCKGTTGVTLPAASNPTHTTTITGVYSAVSSLSVDAGGPNSGNEGSAIALNGASVTNGGTNPHYSWSVDTTGGDSGISCPITNSTSLSNASVTCNDDSNGGTFTATLSYYDDSHGSSASPITDTATLTVNNVAPTVTFSSSNTYTVDESTSAERTFNYQVTDAGSNDTLSVASVSCGSNGSVASDNSNTLDSSGNGTLTCIFPDGPNNSTISVQAQDDDGGTSTAATHSVTINNVKPTPSIDSLTGNSGTACISGNTVTLGFSWTDPAGSYDTYSYDVNWGDGSTHATSSNATSPVSNLQHTYSAGGPYTITVTVNDEDPGSGNSVSSDPFSFLYNVTGVLQPVNDTQAHQDPSIFKYGSTIPVKIEVTDCNATPVSGLTPQIAVKKTAGSTPPTGTDETISSTSGADTGTSMRWSDPIYIYNLATKSLSDSSAAYQITITGPFATVTTLFGTKPK